MSEFHTRRRFLVNAGTMAAGLAFAGNRLIRRALAGDAPPESLVAIARDEALISREAGKHEALLEKLLDAAMQRITGASEPEAAWRALFQPGNRVGIKVNTLGLSTNPAVADAIATGVRRAGVRAEDIIIWDRFDVELQHAGFRLNKSLHGVRCYGTDGDRIGSGYQQEIETSGQIGSCFSRIVAEQVDTLISVPVLKDHNLAGASLGMKNFYGVIHNPNKYHDHNCDPYVADVISHRFIRPKWKLTVIDGTRAQYHAGPGAYPGFSWPFGGLIVSRDVVAADAVAVDLLDAERKARGLKSLSEDDRPPRYIQTAARMGLGVADPNRITRLEV